jgi:hypothetical protein
MCGSVQRRIHKFRPTGWGGKGWGPVTGGDIGGAGGWVAVAGGRKGDSVWGGHTGGVGVTPFDLPGSGGGGDGDGQSSPRTLVPVE